MDNWSVEFYIDDNDNSPVEEFLESLNPKDRAKVFHVIELLKANGIKLREPHAKKIQDKENLFELRSKFANNIQRIFYFHFTGKTFILLHGFTKKTQKMPENELEIAIKRKNNYIWRFENG